MCGLPDGAKQLSFNHRRRCSLVHVHVLFELLVVLEKAESVL
jgi:hypothetical protein